MNEYQPLSIARYCNVGIEVLGAAANSAIGAQTFHGLPFRIGGANRTALQSVGKPVFLGAGGDLGTTPVRISMRRKAFNVIIAHRLLESHLLEGESVGRLIATYRFRYADGEEVGVPIRERFEIAFVPPSWGQGCFLAVSDQKDGLVPRYQGQWGNSGLRQTEALQAWPRSYWLWAWRNPRPDTEIVALEIVPEDRRFIVAAITLGHVDEDPFAFPAKREVKITLPRQADAKRPFGLSVEVDRGVATYPFALPQDDADAFVKSPQKGWGEAQNAASSPAYVEIAAAPSATVTVKNHGEELGAANWSEIERKGKVNASERVRIEVIDRGRNWVHTTVVDADTGKPVPCRIHFRSPEGVPYQPHGHHPRVNSNLGTWHTDVGGDVRLGQITYAYIDGTCQGWLPRGGVIVDVSRGYEYEPLRKMVTVKPGQRRLELKLKRWCHMNAERWFSGDTHVHFLSTQGSHREAQCEDLNVVNLLQSQWGHLFTNVEEFTGRPSVSADGSSIVYATQENRQHMLGHLTLLGLKEPVMPWCSDGPSEAELGGSMETTLSHWADVCHAQGGTVVIPHIPNPNCEPAVLIATGRADAAEFLCHDFFYHNDYYRYLNCGYRLPLVGGTDKMTSDVPVGIYRTYVHIPEDEEFTYDNWCRGLRAGRTFMSGGPIIRFTVDGAPVGSTITLSGNGGTLEVAASAESTLPIHSLEIIRNGEVVASSERKSGARRLSLKAKVKVTDHAWLAARCSGPGYWESVPHHDGWHRGVMAHTSPVYVAVGGAWEMFDLGTAQYMLTLAEGGLAYMRRTAHHYPEQTITHHHGEADHMAFLERPFQEAITAIHRRLHRFGVPH